MKLHSLFNKVHKDRLVPSEGWNAHAWEACSTPFHTWYCLIKLCLVLALDVIGKFAMVSQCGDFILFSSSLNFV